ncbi:MAG: RNA polymerase sigma-70 factor (ECF subfamily) [Planctomycetota bacterium]|jgi:RNA polymerase sigma-70 factor (ECF subfamily)
MAQIAVPDALAVMPRPDQTPNDNPPGDLRAREKARDHELIRNAQAGDQDAFARLVSRHEARAMRVAWGLVGNREDARDIAQDGFLRVFKSLERFDFKHEFTTWLYRIVTNLSIDHLRKKRPVLSTGQLGGGEDAPPFELEDEDAPRPSARLESEETAGLVRDCIESLPEHFSSVLLLRELEGLPCKDISDIVGATQVTVRWRLHRGRKLFQDEWERRHRAVMSDKSGAAAELRTTEATGSSASSLGQSKSGQSQ